MKSTSAKIAAVLVFASIATVLILLVRAASRTVTFEAENVSSNLQSVQDPTASDGSYARFNQSVSATDNFYIVGKDIIDPDGNIFYPIGANVAIKLFSYPYVFEGSNGGANQHIDELKDWNWNTVRATIVCDNDSGQPSFDELVTGLKREIPKITVEKIVVIIECHDVTGKNPQLNSAKEQAIRRFWDRIAVEFKDNPYVWFNIFNEPWSGETTEMYSSIHNFYIDRIRATGAQNIIVVDAPQWGQGIELFAETDLASNIARGECNVMFSWHAYGAFKNQQGSYAQFENAIKQVQARNLALIIGEYGVALPASNGNAGPWQWNVSGFEHLTKLGPQYGVGLQWWHATGDSSFYATYALKNDRSGYWNGGAGNNLTGPGQTFWNASQNAPNLGRFTGNLAGSNCQLN